jgi:hypothetical protein
MFDARVKTRLAPRTALAPRLAAAVLAVLALTGRAAYGSCAAPAPMIIWSYPADGQTDVPTNAGIFFLTTLGAAAGGATINGSALAIEGGHFGYRPPLTPQTDYVVAVGPASAAPIQLRFTTGAGPQPVPPPTVPTVTRVTASHDRALSDDCRAAWNAMDCFDTGQDTHVIFETEAHPLFFVVEPLQGATSVPWPITWPGSCGNPEIYVGSDNGRPRCHGAHRIHAVSITGESASADIDCDVALGAVPDGGAAIGGTGKSSSSGCAIAFERARPSAWIAALLIGLGLGLRRRRATAISRARRSCRPSEIS